MLIERNFALFRIIITNPEIAYVEKQNKHLQTQKQTIKTPPFPLPKYQRTRVTSVPLRPFCTVHIKTMK